MKKLLPYIIGAVVLVLVILLMPAREKEKHFNGHVTLNIKDKNAYGCFVAYQLLHDLYPGTPVVTNRKAPDGWEELSFDSAKAGQVLLIITRYFDPSESDLNYLTSFVQKGNYVFISALEMNYAARKFYKVQQLYLDQDKGRMNEENGIGIRNTIKVLLDTNTFTAPFRYGYPGADFSNEFSTYDTSFTYKLGSTTKGETNLLAINTLEGSIFLHSTPLTFSNLFLLYHDNHEYLEKLLSLMPEKPSKIVWDEYYLLDRKSEENKNSLLSVLLRYENFRWAFWLAVIVLVLYLVTATKRKQRLIPVYRKPDNDSMEFIQTIGKLYYEKGDHQNLAHKMTQFFLDYVRQKYKIDTQYINSEFSAALALKSGITPEEAQQITDHIHQAQLGTMTGVELTRFYGILDHFYKQT